MDYEIRPVDADCTDLITLRRQWHPGDRPQFEQDFRAWWERERLHRRAFVAYSSDGAPVGMANGRVFSRMPVPDQPDTQWLYGANVYVVDAHRRRGVGRALMEAVIELARTEGLVRIVLAPSVMSIPLYVSLGFRPADDLMRLDLTDS